MKNPFEIIEARLSGIENLILDLKNPPIQTQPSQLPESPIFTKEAAEFIGVAVPTMYSKVSKGEIPVSKRGKRLYFFHSELLQYLKEGRKKSNSEIKAEVDELLTKKSKGS